MASRDVLSLSLDDIIRMKGRRGGWRRGRGVGRGALTNRDTEVTRGQGGGRGRGRGRGQGQGRGRGRGRGRGARVLATRLAVSPRGRGARGRGRGGPAGQEGRGAASRRGRGGMVGRGGRGINTGSPGISTRLGRGGGTRGGRIRGVQVRRGRGLFRGRPATEDQQVYQEVGRWDPSFRQRVARHKVQQARVTLARSQQATRKQARFNLISARRGINNEVKSNMGVPLKVRVGRGTVVQGLRSDQLLLHRMKQGSQQFSAPHPYAAPRSGGSEERKAGSVVSLSSSHCLTVSIRNNIASNTQSRGRINLNRNRLKPESAGNNFAPATFTVVNDRAYSPEPLPAPPAYPPSPPRNTTKRSIVSARNPRGRVPQPMMVVPAESARPVPEPHRQVLDPKVQKEIAMLQGKGEVSLNNGPGPGVKGFRHVPSQTTRSLNERFTEERMVTV